MEASGDSQAYGVRRAFLGSYKSTSEPPRKNPAESGQKQTQFKKNQLKQSGKNSVCLCFFSFWNGPNSKAAFAGTR